MKKILMLGALASLLILAFGLGGCGDNGAPTADGNNLSLSFASPKAANGNDKAVAPDTLTAGADTLILSNLQVVLKKIELQACRDTSGGDSIRVEEFETGPLLVDMPLGGSVTQVLEVEVSPGTYNEVEFNLHAVRGGDSTAVAFLAAHPDFADVSIRADGTFNATPFTFTTRMSAHQEIRLDPALVVGDDSGPVNVTLTVDNTMWFVGPDGMLIDPATASDGGPNQMLVERNIRRSFRGYEDRDCDGRDDHHGDPDGGHGDRHHDGHGGGHDHH